ncbi:hypothetical protein ACFWPQ_02150 [Streptomyces sp. NPDC058464]|uniref:hypothetical protein n=1 Tax=Streptomyces sp. NPDC058464 TaxID=3346511 RepID=UPI003666A39A
MSASPVEMPGRTIPVPLSVAPLPDAVKVPALSQQARGYIDGLRALADFLESDPSLRTPSSQQLLIPLMTNAAVEEFAAGHGLAVEYDDEGNASTDLPFGPLAYHVYGYVDFDEHMARGRERQAREWVASQGLELRPAVDGSEVAA